MRISETLSAREFRTFRENEVDQSIPSRFEQQVRLHPRRLAVRCDGDAITYEELNERANRIARAILEERGEAEEAVALFFEPGVDAITATLGALKAGKIYVPLDPSAPPAHVARVLDDSQARLVLAAERHKRLASELVSTSRRLLTLDRVRPGSAADDPVLALSPDRPAYVFYTSGSTGVPKGVVDSHRNVLHNVMRYTNSLRIGPEDRLTLLQRPTFSGSVSNVFGALLNGAAVFPLDVRSDGFAGVAQWLAEGRITIYHSVPSLFRGVMEAAGPLPDLRLARLEGDSCTPRVVLSVRDRPESSVTLVNGLGATETGISRQFFIPPGTDFSGSIVPVGYPTEGVSAIVADDEGRPLPGGQVGEILISSRYLAQGYWRRPDLTAARFQTSAGGIRTFHSGDIGRMRPDGCLEHLGRRDSRMRVRGVFVEGSEIEAALQSIPGIRDARVQMRERPDGDSHIVAYVVPEGPRMPTVTAIRSRLSRGLPEQAIPAAYVSLPALPLDGNGKVDPRQLMPPGRERPELEAELVSPRTPTERLLAGIWSEVLELETVGVHDDFFELGGDSLKAWQVIARLKRSFPFEVPLRLLFDQPTIAGLAGAILRCARHAS